MATPHLTILPGNPDFLDLPWNEPLSTWDSPRVVELPTGVHRHVVRFVAYGERVYAVKELPARIARHEFESLRELESRKAPVVAAAGLVERAWVDPSEEWSGAVITRYLDFAFSYRELISAGGFGQRRNQLLDGLAGLLVELHLLGCFWGDCSLSNVLYRYDAAMLDITMVDGETVELHDSLSAGQRRSDLDIMVVNVAGGMADIAAEQGAEIDDADLFLGEDIAGRYAGLWDELNREFLIGPDEGYLITERVVRLNALGFEVGEVELEPVEDGRRLRLKVEVGGRGYHRHRLSHLTRIGATENQARQILADLRYHEAKHIGSAANKAVAAIQWRVGTFEPLLKAIGDLLGRDGDPVQKYCDFLHHRYIMSFDQGRDVPNEEAFADWVSSGMQGPPPG
ncbi:MAG: DUF4032 domain-containing protein [Acidimicrobiia bacterium]|nr:DUF4032 domain-containing protein [Acidimicrobiia bacterium]